MLLKFHQTSTYSTDWPKVSIITPSYNQGNYIEQTILSVLEQDYPNLEYIIIDGGSTDNTVDIIKKYEKNITYWISEPDRGQSHAINKGIEKCTGEIINWLNSDDWLEPGALHKVAQIFKERSDVLVISGYENHIWENGNSIIREGTMLGSSLAETIEQCQVAQPSTFFRASAFKSIMPVPEDMHYIMDGEIWVRFLLLYGQQNFYKLDQPIVNFRLHEKSKTVSNSVIDNFLIERSSIIVDLQMFIGLPEFLIKFWVEHNYNNIRVKELGRFWEIGDEVNIQELKLYFIKKFINLCFIKNDLNKAKLGITELQQLTGFSKFLLKNLFKLYIKRVALYV